MPSGGRLARIVGVGAALAVPFVPKCPLCLLPLAAALGVALPSGPFVDAAVVAAVAAWLAFTLATAQWLPVKAAAIAAAVLVLLGRGLGLSWAGGAGAVLILALVFWTRRRARACESAACLGSAESLRLPTVGQSESTL